MKNMKKKKKVILIFFSSLFLVFYFLSFIFFLFYKKDLPWTKLILKMHSKNTINRFLISILAWIVAPDNSVHALIQGDRA